MQIVSNMLSAENFTQSANYPASILRKSTSGRQLPWRADDGPI